jgi:hypothetical protein
MSRREPQVRITFRFPVEIHEAIAVAANANGHSTNAELVSRIRKSLEADIQAADSEMLRDRFAMAALSGYFAAPNTGHRGCGREEAEYIWSMADAMLATRKGGAQ